MKGTNMGGGAETFRRVAAGVFMWGGWLTAAAVFLYATLNYNPNQGHFAPQWVGFAFIASLCVGISGTLVRSRYRLSDAILSAFAIGMQAAREDVAKARSEHTDLYRKINE